MTRLPWEQEEIDAQKVCDKAGLTNDDWDEGGGYMTVPVAGALEDAYKKGKKDGIRLFAWWKDGVQYVGSGVYTLEEVLKEVEDGN